MGVIEVVGKVDVGEVIEVEPLVFDRLVSVDLDL